MRSQAGCRARGDPPPVDLRARAGHGRPGGWQRLVDQLPSLWALGLAASFFVSDRRAHLAVVPIAVSLCLSVGFWCLFFAGGRWLYRRSRGTLLVTTPLLLVFVAMGGVQQLHHFLFGEFIGDDRMPLIQLNWDTILDELIRSAGALPAPMVLAAVLGMVLPFAVYVVGSQRSPFTPLVGAGGVRTLAALLWLGWFASEYGFHELSSAHTPDLAGQVFANEIRESVAKGLPSATGDSEIAWTVERAGTANVAPEPEPSPADAAPAIRPNVVLILLESVRADHLPSYGHHRNTMPFVAELAAAPETFQVEHAYGNASLSYFSMLSLLSGMALSRSYDAFATAPLLWDHLAARGYESFVVTQSIGYPRYRLDAYMQTPGLDSYLDVGRARVADFHAGPEADGLLSGLRRRMLGGFFEALGVERDDQWSLEAFQERILARDPTRPFFGMWELECTHYPYCYPDAFQRFEPAKAYLHSRDPLGALRNDYDNALLYSDHMIQRLMSFIDAQGLSHDTVVVITSDHGESFLEREALFHAGTPHVEQTRVPLLLIIPRAVQAALGADVLDTLSANRRVPAQLIDILPTLVDLAEGARRTGPLPGDGDSLLRPIDPDREVRVTNYPPFRATRRRNWREARVSRQQGYVVVYGDGRPPERYGLDGRPFEGE